MNDKTIAKISFFGALLTLLVISLGAWVRLTDSGLGCPDWPGCYGIFGTPDTDAEIAQAKALYPDAKIDIGKVWREMLHRYLAGILGIYIIAASYFSLKYSKGRSAAVPMFLILLIFIQSMMGMLTITELVKPTIVTTHLLLGMITASLIFWNGLRFQPVNFEFKNYDIKLVTITLLCTLALIIQIILGGWTSTNYASLACTDFPRCLGQWWPENMQFENAFRINDLPNINYEGGFLDYNSKVTVHFIHRLGALLVTILFSILFIYIFYIQKNEIFKKIGIIILVFFLVQILLGISNIVHSLPLSIAVLHTVNAAILLMSMSTLLFYSTDTTHR